MEYIQAGEYERQIEGKIDFDAPYTPEPENAEFYKRVMKRINVVLKMMALFLASGSHISLEDYKLKGLLATFLDEDDRALHEDETNCSLLYSTGMQCFCVVNVEGEIVIEDVDIDIAMDIYNEFLLEQEQDELYKKAIRDVQEKEEDKKGEERE